MPVENGSELLDETECRRLLASGTIGRVGLSMAALPAIFPVEYTVAEDAVVFRIPRGLELLGALDRSVVAFEVDAGDPQSRDGWSVLVVGMAEVVPGGDPAGRVPVLPAAGGVPGNVVRIPITILSGRRTGGDCGQAEQASGDGRTAGSVPPGEPGPGDQVVVTRLIAADDRAAVSPDRDGTRPRA